MSEKKTTVREVAREANVSIATVSRFLNQDYSGMSEDTKQRLAVTVETLGYVNPRTKQNRTAALVLPGITDPFFASLVETVSAALERAGFSVQLCLTHDSPEQEEHAIRRLLTPAVSGVVYISTVTSKENCYDLLKNAGKPFVVLDNYLSEYNAFALVFSNGVYAMYEATNYLLEQGHRRIAYLSGMRLGMFEHYRYQGYVNSLLDAGLQVDPRLVRFVGFNQQDGYHGFRDLLKAGEEFSAVICESDLLAAGVYQACHQAGLRIPEDVSVIGFNNSLVCTLLEPALTSVDQQLDILAEQAVQVLEQQIRGEVLSERTKKVPTKLVCRDSVRSLAESGEKGIST